MHPIFTPYQNLTSSPSFCKKQKLFKIVKNLLISTGLEQPHFAILNFFDENTLFVLYFHNFTTRGLNNSKKEPFFPSLWGYWGSLTIPYKIQNSTVAGDFLIPWAYLKDPESDAR